MYKIIREKRKTFSIRIDEREGVIIKVPYHMKTSKAEELIEKYEGWIKKALEKKKAIQEENDWQVTGKILYLGELVNVHIKPSVFQSSKVLLTEEGLVIRTPAKVSKEELTQLMEGFYRKEAQKLLMQLTKHYASLLNVNYNKISVRKQKTRWGSCSAKGNLSYNVKMLCAPQEMIEYVVLHEVMHLKHFNHGKAFWQEIEKVMPDYKKRKDYFKKYGQTFII